MSNQNKKIVFFIPNFSLGGGEKALITIGKMLAEKGSIIHVVTMRAKGPYSEILGNNIVLVELGTKRLSSTIFSLANYLRKEKPDFIISTAEHAHIVSFFAKKIARVNTKVVVRIGIVLSIVFRKQKRFFDKYIIPYLLKIVLRGANRIVCVSYGILEDIQNFVKLPSEKISVIYTPKDITEIQNMSKEIVDHPWFSEKDLPIIIGAGRINEQKDFKTLINTFDIVSKKVKSRLVIIGNPGSDQKNIESLIENLSLSESVVLLGFVKNPYALFAKSDVFVLSSKNEGLPNVLIEALATGVPVVATDCLTGPREILLGSAEYGNLIESGLVRTEFGILTPVGDFREIANAILEILNNDEKAGQYSRNGKIKSRDFDKSVILNKYEEVFK